MQADQWLLLTDYASKYRISVSTLRRRIKAGQISFRFEGGKYFIFDSPPAALDDAPAAPVQTVIPGLRPVLARKEGSVAALAEEKLRDLQNSLKQQPPPSVESSTAPSPISTTDSGTATGHEEPIISTATKLLGELKRAYMNILQEKEEQIINLKEEVSDLKTLVIVLEDDNERLRRHLRGSLQSHP